MSTLRSGDDPVPIVLRAATSRRSNPSERLEVQELIASDVSTPAGTLPVAALSSVSVEWLPSVLHHRSGRRVARVLAECDGAESYLLGLPCGFVALLGAIALIGIAVNGAIVLLDVTEQERAAGLSVVDALTEAVRRRTRPILLTTATTVAGLVPLLVSESTLWPWPPP